MTTRWSELCQSFKEGFLQAWRDYFAPLRWIYRRWYFVRHSGEILNRRAEVEQELLDVANGKKPLLSRNRCRKLALKLGVPE